MTTLNVTLPETLQQFIDEEVAKGKHGSPNDYVLQLIREAQVKQERARIDALVLEGIRSERSDMTQDDWNELRRRAEEREQRRSVP